MLSAEVLARTLNTLTAEEFQLLALKAAIEGSSAGPDAPEEDLDAEDPPELVEAFEEIASIHAQWVAEQEEQARLDEKLESLNAQLMQAQERAVVEHVETSEDEAEIEELRRELADNNRRNEMYQQAIDARDLRLELTREATKEAGRKIEALKVRSAIAEETLRSKDVQMGLMLERLKERKQQSKALTKTILEARIKLDDIDRWWPDAACDEALTKWRAHAKARKAAVEKLRGVIPVWRAAALRAALVCWRRHGREWEDDPRVVMLRQRRALRELELACEPALRAVDPEMALSAEEAQNV